MADYESEWGQGYRAQDQFQRFESFYSTYKTSDDRQWAHEDLIKSIEYDKEFTTFFNLIREQESIFTDFPSLDNNKKIEILIKTRDQKEHFAKVIEQMRIEKEEIGKKSEVILKEREDTLKIKINNIKIENEVLKNELSDYKKTNLNLQNEQESLKHKIKELKQINLNQSIKTYDEDGGEYFLIEDNKKLKEEIEKLRTTIESVTKMKENLEKISKDYVKKYEQLETKHELIINQNIELMEKNKKFEHMSKFERGFSSTTTGIKLEGLMLTDSNNMERITESEELEEDNNFGGFIKVHMKPLNLNGTHHRRPGGINFNHTGNKEMLTREINMITSEILEKKEENDPNQMSNLLEFGSANYSSASEKEKFENTVNDQFESHNSEYLTAIKSQQLDYDANSYNSFNFESRVADYVARGSTILKDKEFTTSYSRIASIVPADRVIDYIPPKSKNVIEYTKDDFPSNLTEENENLYQYKGSFNNKDYITDVFFSEYEYETQPLEKKTNYNMSNQKDNFLSQDLSAGKGHEYADYNSLYVYDTNANYYVSGVDPK